VLELKMVIREAYAKTHGWAPTMARICWCFSTLASFVVFLCFWSVNLSVYRGCDTNYGRVFVHCRKAPLKWCR
jgi:hypothetical protein